MIGQWAMVFNGHSSLTSMASNWRTVFLCLYYRQLQIWAHSGLALGAVEVRPMALRVRPIPLLEALKLVPMAQPRFYHQDGCLRGPHILGTVILMPGPSLFQKCHSLPWPGSSLGSFLP